MRKLLVLLSVVLLFALCQSQKVKDRKTHKFHKECIFGYKKVNNTKVCKTKEEFLKHPRNDTNCTANKVLKKFKINNVTFTRCVFKRNGNSTHVPKHRNCTEPGFVRRCKVDKFTGKNVCRCIRLGPPVREPNPDIVCEEGKVKHCNKRGVCICRPPKPGKTTVVEEAVGLF